MSMHPRVPPPDPDLRRTWLFGPGADAAMHAAMLASGADVLIFDLEALRVLARAQRMRLKR